MNMDGVIPGGRKAPYERWAEEFRGCGDNSCNIKAPMGMGTNGGCRCRPAILRVVMGRMKRYIEKLEDET
jgi:hypothetical protein